ncbi:MAG: type I DNA topoisomerase [Chitinophagales bacterium]|nr:type I DNA topoisomerase [Chitinophagales bacterium]
MPKNLLIVESPAKAKTITKYLGGNFIVASSYGHIRDLPKNNRAIDIENGFVPSYEVSKEKEKVVAELKKLKKEVKEVYLATDEDREGEAISWHLCEVLKLDPKTTKRVTYSEITESAIKKAIASPRNINMNLVNAQQARRVLDRIVGFEISPILWRKVRPNLSAGRVQSVAVRLIVEREREIQQFQAKMYYKVAALFDEKDIEGKPVKVKAESSKDLSSDAEAKKVTESFVGAKFSISKIEKKAGKKSPVAPFTTSTLQQEASKKMGYSVAKTMQVAQRLYEAGHITYMRTDSVNLSDTAIADAQKAIEKFYGKNYHKMRKYTSKIANAQEAHEAIRPTSFAKNNIDADSDEIKLYDLIWKRAIASQMSDAAIENTIVTIGNDKNQIDLTAKQEVVTFEGFLKAYMIEKDEDDEENSGGFLPPMKEGQAMMLNNLTATQKFTKHPARYNEASLVKKLEELGIGRPSTYAPTISTIQNREYVLKDYRDGKKLDFQVYKLEKDKVSLVTESMITGAEKAKLFPTDIGMLVTDFLKIHFEKVIDYKFTANMEEDFDEISNGKIEWQKMLERFYKPFHEEVETTLETAERVSGERSLGNHPDSKEPMIARMGRFGPMVQIGVTDENNPDYKPRYARLRKDQSIETITMEQALDLFKLPRILGEFEGKELKVNVGRFGPYVQQGSTFTSLKKEDDVMSIDLETAIQRIIYKRESDAKKLILDFTEEGIQVLQGRWGPFIKQGKENYRIPKGVEAEKLTLEVIQKIIKGEFKTEAIKTSKKTAKATAKKTAKKTAKTTKKK